MQVDGDWRRAVLGETPFLPQPAVTAEYSLEGDGTQYIVLPCTFAPGRRGSFTLACTASADFQFEQL